MDGWMERVVFPSFFFVIVILWGGGEVCEGADGKWACVWVPCVEERVRERVDGTCVRKDF